MTPLNNVRGGHRRTFVASKGPGRYFDGPGDGVGAGLLLGGVVGVTGLVTLGAFSVVRGPTVSLPA